MKKNILLLIVAVFLSAFSYSQIQVLKDFDFNSGGYYLLGTYSESDKNGLRDTLGEFYTDSIPLLNQFKQEWIFSTPGERYSCGYHYRIYICKNKAVLKTIWINLNCNELVCDGRYFYFNSDKLRTFKGKLKKLKTVYEDFKTIEEARHKRKEILNHPKLICTPYKPWIDYEGEFWFTYTYPNPKTDYLPGAKVFLDKLTAELKNSYPDEPFILDDMGGSLTEKFVHVYCNKSLSEKFSLYPREGWSDLKPDLISYWIP